LTPVYDLTVHWTDDEARQQIAAALNAVMKAIARLDQHYQRIKSNPSKIQRDYPFQTSCVDQAGVRTNFTYTGRIGGKLVFTAVSEGGELLVVKFTRQYSETAHHFLADLGHAPALRAVNSLHGGWKVILMAQSRYTHLDSSALSLDNESRLTIKQKVLEIVEKLHAQELVHGDIRQVNILVDQSTLGSPDGVSVHIIDFDWAGQAGRAKYPLRINTQSIRRPRDVAGGVLITKTHDLGMIDLLFYSV
jgi:serine/threonine protein kinase